MSQRPDYVAGFAVYITSDAFAYEHAIPAHPLRTHMNVLTTLLRTPPAIVSRRRLATSLVGIAVLAAMVFGHAVALTLFLWGTTSQPSGVAGLVFLWVVSAIALFLLLRFARRAAFLWRTGSTTERQVGE